ncbi:MAG TPA: hypothetical protein VF665_08465 [Longimicrobium sp.]|jgi:chorismate-pyruvate lyase|uniref:hypothetical protein n=1 Tax=Longimicrobium sp. TaxID=2029185 RepID=UPI002ED79576
MRLSSRWRRALVAAAVACLAVAPARAQNAPAWPDALLTRTQALALVQELNAEILASRSATASLEAWCGAHGLAPEARVVAEVVPVPPVAASAEQRARLGVDSAEEVRHRHVRLRCGARVLSEADNWYVPGRLTPEMNRLLQTTDTPFGRVIAGLEPYRRTFLARLLWQPLAPGWAHAPPSAAPCASAGILLIPDALFEHRALVYGRDHRPLAEVYEVYQRGLLAFPAPPPC